MNSHPSVFVEEHEKTYRFINIIYVTFVMKLFDIEVNEDATLNVGSFPLVLYTLSFLM